MRAAPSCIACSGRTRARATKKLATIEISRPAPSSSAARTIDA
jgi:hypothetical protein